MLPLKLEIPGSIWNRPDMLAALQSRDIAHVFRLVRQHAGMSQTAIGSLIGMSQGKVSGIMAGNQQVTTLDVYERIADGLRLPDTARTTLGLAPRKISARDGSDSGVPATIGSTRSVERDPRPEEGGAVRRREFVGLTGAALFGAILAATEPAPDPAGSGIDDLATALTEAPLPTTEPADLARLTSTVNAAKRKYQACKYGEVLTILPPLLRSLRTASSAVDGIYQRKTQALTAEAYHVAASILLKQGDKGLAWLAADRSVSAAQLSDVPLMIGSSARIITHALMDGGHHRAAASNASGAAQRMDAALTQPTADDLSVYGSLLLRGSIAAAHNGDRHTSTELLDQAEQAGGRLGHEGNHMWTAFGPNNVLCHRVSAALRFGDAGTAIEYARRVDLEALPINERKAVLLLDVTRAFLMWGKHDQALHTIQAAGQIAPEEITGRPRTRQLVGDLVATAPISVRREAREFADAHGIAA